MPTGGFLLTFMCATTSQPRSTRSTSSSTRPPVGFSPNRRALTTWVSLNTSRSPGVQQRRQLAEHAVGRRQMAAIEQARGAAFGGRVLGDQFGGQGEVEVAQREVRACLRAGRSPFQEGRQNCPMPAAQALSAPQKALRKLGLARDIDLALHLPLRYEDETRIVQLRDARDGDTVQIEGAVTDSQVAYRPRRQLVVTVDDGTDTCVLRFFSFYPSQQKALAVGNRILRTRRAQGRPVRPPDGAPGVQARRRRRCRRR